MVSKGKKSLFITGHARRVRCIFIFSANVPINILIGHLGRPRSTHTAPVPVPMGSVHAQIVTKPSCWSCRKSLRVGRARRGKVCFYRHGWAVFTKLGAYVQGTSTRIIIYHHVFFGLETIMASEASASSTGRPTECVPCGSCPWDMLQVILLLSGPH